MKIRTLTTKDSVEISMLYDNVISMYFYTMDFITWILHKIFMLYNKVKSVAG